MRGMTKAGNFSSSPPLLPALVGEEEEEEEERGGGKRRRKPFLADSNRGAFKLFSSPLFCRSVFRKQNESVVGGEGGGDEGRNLRTEIIG